MSHHDTVTSPTSTVNWHVDEADPRLVAALRTAPSIQLVRALLAEWLDSAVGTFVCVQALSHTRTHIYMCVIWSLHKNSSDRKSDHYCSCIIFAIHDPLCSI